MAGLVDRYLGRCLRPYLLVRVVRNARKSLFPQLELVELAIGIAVREETPVGRLEADSKDPEQVVPVRLARRHVRVPAGDAFSDARTAGPAPHAEQHEPNEPAGNACTEDPSPQNC